MEQLSSPPLEVEPVRRGKISGRASGGRSGAGSTWGSISRVFARNRHRKVPSPNSQDGMNFILICLLLAVINLYD